MYDLAVAIFGNEETTYNNAADLLDDYIPDNSLVLIPSYISSEGLKKVFEWLKDTDIEYERVQRSKMFDHLIKVAAKKTVVIVVGITGIENEIVSFMSFGVPVYDLTRGLYSVTSSEMALDGVVSHAETLSPQAGMAGGVEKDLVSPSHTETPLIDNVSENEMLAWAVENIKKLTDEVNRLKTHVGIAEHGWEPAVQIPDHMKEPEQNPEPDPTEGKIRYYRNGKGKHRKAGNSKARPGEKEVWLTEDEVESLTS